MVVKVEHPEVEASFNHPGAPCKFEASPWQIKRRAPMLEEDNEAVYIEELGLVPLWQVQPIIVGLLARPFDTA